MVRKRTIGLAAAVLAGGLTLARAIRTETTDAPSDSPVDRTREVLSDPSPESVDRVRDALAADSSTEAESNADRDGLLSNYTLRGGVYLDHATNDSTFAFEWRQE